MYKTLFLTEAFYELENAAKWYADQQVGLDNKFVENIFAAIENYTLIKLSTGKSTASAQFPAKPD